MVLRFYVGLHQPSDAWHFERCCIHVQRLATRRKPLGCIELLLDSRAWSELRLHGQYRTTPELFADQIHRSADARAWSFHARTQVDRAPIPGTGLQGHHAHRA